MQHSVTVLLSTPGIININLSELSLISVSVCCRKQNAAQSRCPAVNAWYNKCELVRVVPDLSECMLPPAECSTESLSLMSLPGILTLSELTLISVSVCYKLSLDRAPQLSTAQGPCSCLV